MNEETEPQGADAAPRHVDPKLLEALVCPISRGPLTYDREAQELVSARAKLAFPRRLVAATYRSDKPPSPITTNAAQ